MITAFKLIARKYFVASVRYYKMTGGNQVKYLTQDEAINLDKELFEECAFSVDQLMELAGLSVATSIARTYSLPNHNRPIICCGPGNNGGDGLVCARHLKLFGYSPMVICPKPGRGQLFQNLLVQCRKFDITIMDTVPNQQERFNELGNLIVDSVFGFSYKPPNRSADYATLLNLMHSASARMPLVCVDIPSGWHVEKGYSDIDEDQADVGAELKIPALQPDCLISLTAPKLCAKSFKGRYHYLGGRFCPESLHNKYKLNLPTYPGEDCIVRLG
uniref:NAD(P)H-hydrate epimerase n=1 Tax=Aceria tosichella TaxID=561515 RepID=A0A6G1SK75_9ACAR